jgi:hypothetical protein
MEQRHTSALEHSITKSVGGGSNKSSPQRGAMKVRKGDRPQNRGVGRQYYRPPF